MEQTPRVEATTAEIGVLASLKSLFVYLFADPAVMICLLLFNPPPPVASLSESELRDKVKVIVLIETLPLAPVS